MEALSIQVDAGSTARLKRRICRQFKDLPQGAAVLFEDETDLMLFPPLRSGWTKRGQPAAVEISGVNAKRVDFGTISLTGHRLMLVRPNQRSIDSQEFLKLVHSHYCHRQMLMILDSNHQARRNAGLLSDNFWLFQ